MFWSLTLATDVYIWSLRNNHGTSSQRICKRAYVDLSQMLKKKKTSKRNKYFVDSGSTFTSFYLFTEYCVYSFISVPMLLTKIITSSRKHDTTPDLSEYVCESFVSFSHSTYQRMSVSSKKKKLRPFQSSLQHTVFLDKQKNLIKLWRYRRLRG